MESRDKTGSTRCTIFITIFVTIELQAMLCVYTKSSELAEVVLGNLLTGRREEPVCTTVAVAEIPGVLFYSKSAMLVGRTVCISFMFCVVEHDHPPSMSSLTPAQVGNRAMRHG